jgi:GNAT superfamily N-acetyltransferase
MSNAKCGLQSLKIEKTSFVDMNKIVKMTSSYHGEDPKFQEILSNPVKLFFYRLFGPLYVWLKFESYKAVVSAKAVGYMLLKHQVHGKSSMHIWDIAVNPEFRGIGIGTSLMMFAEKIAEGKYQYLTLAVMENNTGALKLYQKLGYRNLLDSPICFRIRKIPSRTSSWNTIKLESISGYESLSCRNAHLSTVVQAVSGFDGQKIYRSLYLLGKLQRGIDRFKIVISSKEAGYISVGHKKNPIPVFFVLHPDFWETEAEVEVIKKIMGNLARASKDQIEMCVMQAYEKSFTKALDKMDCVSERMIGRLGLVKKLEEI